jgi:hypothetical protein
MIIPHTWSPATSERGVNAMDVGLLHINSKRGEVFPIHAMNAYRRSRAIAPLILNLGTRWR